MSTKNQYLQVVNASAGSGKTFSLVKTYIELLLLDDLENTDRKYTEILAMTFTNKAALEMKTRIVKALDELAYSTDSGYVDLIVASTGLKKEVVQEKSKRLLNGILHHYEDFHVMTIDKFNLKLIRSFSRDLDLPPDFEVVLNEKLLIEQVVDGVLNKIGTDAELSKVLLMYANSNLEEEKRWNFRGDLIKFAEILSKEQDLPYVEHLMKMEFSEEDYNQTRNQLRQLNETYRGKCVALKNQFDQAGFVAEDFSSGKNICNSVKKLESVKLLDKFPITDTNIKNIEKAAGNSAPIADFYSSVLSFVTWWEKHFVDALVLDKYLKKYFNMQLLQYLNADLLELNRTERLIRISEFNTKISSLLKDDALYIYEKLGTRFRHFMLDEFQDTSRLQWLNLIPLVRESLSTGQKNFIVGDPKQAIYRFKNGVAEQFVELPGIYNPEKDAELEEVSNFFREMGRLDTLEDNYRSATDIVTFNNRFFEELKSGLTDYQRKFYSSVVQSPISSNRGYVYVESAAQTVFGTRKSAVKDVHLNFVDRSVADAIAGGFKLGDICVLGRTNDTCVDIANHLSNQGISVVSADSLLIDSELSVRFVLSYFKLRLNPVNQNLIRQFFYQYYLLFEHDLSFYNSLFEKIETNGKTYKIAKIDLFFQKIDDLEEGFFEPFETLYDLVEKTYALFGLHELKNPYLHHFADLVHLFETKNGPDLNLFLQDYQSLSKEARSLQIPESDQAVKIMTIHKSKGLEFPIVIVVNENSNTNNQKEYFVETEDCLLRTSVSKNSPIKEVQELSDSETEKSYLDVLNMYYVAFTRPVHRLYISNIYKSPILTDFHKVFEKFETAVEDQSILKLELGEKLPKEADSEQVESNYFSPESSEDNLWFPDIALQDTEELHSEDFLSDEQRYGNQFHLAISSIHQQVEIDSVLEKLLLTGQIEKEFIPDLKKDLNQLFSTSTYNDLFNDAVEILSEQNYIISKNEQMRPDKIIVKKDKTIILDFKTGQPLKKHKKQLEVYRSVLQEMNYPKVEAHLFYTKNFELVTI